MLEFAAVCVLGRKEGREGGGEGGVPGWWYLNCVVAEEKKKEGKWAMTKNWSGGA